MQYDDFVGLVQHHARLGTQGEAMRVIRATLETLGERLAGGAPGNLAAQLPEAIGAYLPEESGREDFGVDEFYQRVVRREGVDLPEAIHHARVVLGVVKKAITIGEYNKLVSQFPEEYADLFQYDVDEVVRREQEGHPAQRPQS